MALSLQSLFSSLKPPAPEVARTVGIDIGSSSIKVVELEQTERAPVLRTYGELQLGPYAGKELGACVQLEPQQQLEAVVDVLREAGVTAKTGVLLIPLSASFVTVVPLMADPEEDLQSRIPVEARKYIPVAASEVTLDWIEVPTTPNEEKPTREVLMVALQNEALQKTNQLLGQVGMLGQPTELEIFSSVRATITDQQQTYAIIDLGASRSRLYIVRDGIVVRLHHLQVGGMRITEQVAKQFSLAFADAEMQKRDANNQDVLSLAVDVLRPALVEFGNILARYERDSGLGISQVMLGGGVSTTVGLAPIVQDQLQRSVIVANPFTKVGYPLFMEDVLRTIGPSFVPAVGAALRIV